jgi:hypothetical protein
LSYQLVQCAALSTGYFAAINIAEATATWFFTEGCTFEKMISMDSIAAT